MDRNLDGCYFRVDRGDGFESVCFSDLDEAQMRDVTEGRPAEWLRSLLIHVARCLRAVGDEFGISAGDGEEGAHET